MDVDLEGLYEDDSEVYDTPQQTLNLHPDGQHHSAPTLQLLPLSQTNKAHGSAPNLENDRNSVNIPRAKLDADFSNNQRTSDLGASIDDENEHEIYMNTTLHAEEKIISRKNSVVHKSSGSLKSTVSLKPEELFRQMSRTLKGRSPDEFYMAPPPTPPGPLIPPKVASKPRSQISHCPIRQDSMEAEVQMELYDAPINPHGELPPLPGEEEGEEPGVLSENEEGFYEGINDNEVGGLYEGLGNDSDNYYEGLENQNDFYEGIDYDDDGDESLYEGIPNDNDVFYEGLHDSDHEVPKTMDRPLDPDEECLRRLKDSLCDTDCIPYAPPKPPSVPFKFPSSNSAIAKPLPDLPVTSNGVKKSPSLQGLGAELLPQSPRSSSMISKSRSLFDVASRPTSRLSQRTLSNSSLSSDGLYDGIDMESDSEKDDTSEMDDLLQQGSSMRRSLSMGSHQLKGGDPKQRTSQWTLDHWKETLSSTFTEKKWKWKDSKAMRNELKTAIKETKTKANELVLNTETIYNSGLAAIQRRTSRSRRKSTAVHAAQPLLEEEERTLQQSQHKQLETSLELEESFTPRTPKDMDFKSFPMDLRSETGEVAGSSGSKYYDLEASGSSGNRSSVGSRESRCNVQISSVYLEAPEMEQSSELEEPKRISIERLEEEGYAIMDGHVTVNQVAEEVPARPAATLPAPQPDPLPPRTSPKGERINSHVTAIVSDRHKVLQTILDHEYRYIMSLKDLMKVYAGPLQHSTHHKSLLDPTRAQEIFFKVPEITVHHEFFYEQLRRRSMTWSRHQSLGDILLQLFHKPGLFSAYASYMDNYNHALEIVREARAARPAFSKLLDKLRTKSNQMSLEDLIFLPVDHIPVYLELLKELIRQTSQEDPDYTYLYLAKDEVEKLIEKLNERKLQAEKSFSVKALEKKISGLPCSLIAPQRYIISVERVKELDIMTDRSDDRQLVVMSDLLLCLKPISRSSSTGIMSTSNPAEYQYVWDCLVTDVKITTDSNDLKEVDQDDSLDPQGEGCQGLKEDLLILQQIDQLRKQLNSSYSSVRFDKLGEVQEKLRREISERQFSEESRRGRILDIVRPINSPCTSTQFHRYLFNTAAKRSKWTTDFQGRAGLMQHTKDLDWCQVGEPEQVPSFEQLSLLLPVIKHMTPIGLTTPSHFSVECAAANADFTCPLTQDILYRIMSQGESYEKYANVEDSLEIPVVNPSEVDLLSRIGSEGEVSLPKSGHAPSSDTPLYDEDLTPTLPGSGRTLGSETQEELPPLRHAPPRIISPLSQSPFAIDSQGKRQPARSLSQDGPGATRPLSLPRTASLSETCAPPLPGNHPLLSGRPLAEQKTDRQSLADLIEREFNPDNEDVYETPDEINYFRTQSAREMMHATSQEIPVLQEEESEPSMGSSDLSINQSSDSSSDQEAVTPVATLAMEIPSPPPSSGYEEPIIEVQEEGDSLEGAPPSALVNPLSRFDHLNLEESFNLELSGTREGTTSSSKTDTGGSAPLLVDKFGQVYTDKIASLLSGPSSTMPSRDVNCALEEELTPCQSDLPEVLLPDEWDRCNIDVSLCELDSDDEDDTPNVYDSQLQLKEPCIDSSFNSGLSTPKPGSLVPSKPSLSTTLHSSLSTNAASLERDVGNPADLPHIVLAPNELGALAAETEQLPGLNTSVYENFSSTPRKLRTKVIRRESSKRSISRKPLTADSQLSLTDDEWLERDQYENINEGEGQFELKPTDVFLCGHGTTGNGEIVVLRLTEPTPHIALNIALTGSQVLCCHMVPGNGNTLWVGTQDARLLVYQMNDPSSSLFEENMDGGPVVSISHIEDSVFVGTSDGYIHVFTRDASVNEWCDNGPVSKKLGAASICVMLPIGGQMWVSCGCQIFVISPRNVTVEHLFSTHNNTSAQVYKMVNSGSGVWLAIRNSPVIRLFHAKTGEHLEDYDISTVVHHLFTGAPNCTRRRRAENVRVTSLLASSSTGALWIGTSSGVVVVVPIAKPPVAPKVIGAPFLSYMGHYDGVRFLMQAQSLVRKHIVSESNEEEDVFEEITSQVIISCGKGMEDFRDHTTRTPSKSSHLQNSSYLIVWHYPSADEST